MDGMAYVDTEGDHKNAHDFIDSNPDVTKSVATQRLNAEMSGTNVLFVVAKDQNELEKIVGMKDTVTGEKVSLEPGRVVITEKLSLIKKLSVGDTIDIKDINNKTYEYQISGIVKNYFDHFIFLDETDF